MSAGLVIAILAIVIVVFFAMRGSGSFDDPKPMSNQHLLAAIAGQADWLEKMRRAPIESQMSSSIVEVAQKRKAYMAQLCVEVISRAHSSEEQLKYPGATSAINVLSETAKYAKALEAKGIPSDKAAVRAVKEKLFAENGAAYPANWEA